MSIFTSGWSLSSLALILAFLIMMLMEEISAKHFKHFSSPEDAYRHQPYHWVITLLFVAALVCALIYMNDDLSMWKQLVNISNPRAAWSNIEMLFTLDWDYFFGIGSYTFSEGVIYQIFVTFSMAFIGTLIASLLALPFGLLASRKLCGKWAWISEILLISIRTFPELIFAIILVKFTGLSAVSGILALGIHSIGMIGKLYGDQIDGIVMEPLESISACGGNAFQRVHLGVMPQVRPNLLSVALYRFDINVRTATILGVILLSEGGIGYSLSALRDHYHMMGSCILGVVILVVGIDLFSSWVRKKLV
ncbi:MAG: ABC transporter permease subunit [Bacilli bacterium]|jgi:phosphonate transport system permease protein|nr:ABC transporter permease subunit [Bacilli bacterium]